MRSVKAQATELPTGTVTFLFTDIEGSTHLARTLGDRWPVVLDEHHRILRKAVRDHGGIDIQTEGDALFAVFRSAVSAVAACADAQRGLMASPQHTIIWLSSAVVRFALSERSETIATCSVRLLTHIK